MGWDKRQLVVAVQFSLPCYSFGAHDDFDRFFSRLHVAIAGRDYYTVVAGLMKVIVDGLPGFNISDTRTCMAGA